MENKHLEEALKDWADLSNEYFELETLHRRYMAKLDEMYALQRKCVSGVHHQRYRVNAIKKLLRHNNDGDNDERGECDDLAKVDIVTTHPV